MGCGSKPRSDVAVPGPDLNGRWQSGASTYRLTSDGTKLTAVFESVSSEGQTLGFKAGDLSFEGTRKGNFILGDQVIRYPSNIPCHQTGRRVPFIGMIGTDGQRVVIDWYNVSLDVPTCQDVGRSLGNTLLERRAG
jgi:hypothetical protein